jgi:hypothetical protein
MRHLEQQPFGPRLSELSVQTKVEKFVLAELAYGGRTLPDFEFWLEERRRDLTIRRVTKSSSLGPLLEWVEAKMCYSDCVARHLTGRPRPDEYQVQVARDVAKQNAGALEPSDASAILTAALFVFHRTEPHPRHIYYPGFKHRGEHTAAAIKSEALRYCTKQIPMVTGRPLSEQFELRLDCRTELLGFCYSAFAGASTPKRRTATAGTSQWPVADESPES